MATNSKCLHPGRVLHDEVMKPLGISRNKLARDLDVPVARISAIVSGTRSITADTALRLEKHLGTSAEFWMKLQAAYDVEVARIGSWRNIEPRVRVFKQGANDGDEITNPNADAEADVPPTPELPEVKSDWMQSVDPAGTFHEALDKPTSPEPSDFVGTSVVEPNEVDRICSFDLASTGSQVAEKVSQSDEALGEPTVPELAGSLDPASDEPQPLESTSSADASGEELDARSDAVTSDEPPPLELTCIVDLPEENEYASASDNEELTIPSPPASAKRNFQD